MAIRRSALTSAFCLPQTHSASRKRRFLLPFSAIRYDTKKYDIITFTIAERIQVGVNEVPVPPGRWSVAVEVPNDSGFAPTAGPAPAMFVSNDVWIDIQPPVSQAFRLYTDEAFCIEETDGPRSEVIVLTISEKSSHNSAGYAHQNSQPARSFSDVQITSRASATQS